VDELAHDTQRATLLDAIEAQLRQEEQLTRLVFACQLADDKRVHAQIEREFQKWLAENDAEKTLTGFSVLLSVAPASGLLHYMEGKTEKLFAALKFFEELSTDRGDNRPALTSPTRIIYFTEMHRARLMPTWAMIVHVTKLGPQNQQQEVIPKSVVFLMYKKLLVLAAKVHAQTKDEPGKESAAKSVLKNSVDLLPSIDDVLMLVGKVGQEVLFSYTEFEKTFIAPFHTVLQSELLWPMPPPLSY